MTDKGAQPVLASDNRNLERASVKRSVIFTILTVVCLGIASLFYAVKLMNEGLEASATTERSETMFVTQQKSAANHRVLPIDESVPGRIETATFALG